MSSTSPYAAGREPHRRRHRLVAAAAVLALTGMIIAVLVALGSPQPAHAVPSARPQASAAAHEAVPAGVDRARAHPRPWTGPVTSTR